MSNSGAAYELRVLLTLQGFDMGASRVDRLARSFRGLGGGASGAHSTINRVLHGLNAAREIGDVWHRQYESLHAYTDEAMRLLRAQSKFEAINLTPEENRRAFEAARRTVAEISGISQTDAVETITDLHTALGDLHHAIEALPIASKYRSAFTALFGDKYNSDQIEEQIRAAFKFLEVTGKVARGREEMERSFNVMTQMAAATGGRVNASELLLMARRGGPAVQGLTAEGLRNLSSGVQELGGSGLGTSLMSLYQALVAGTMKKSALAEFNRLGLVDTSKIETGKHSDIIKRALPGAIKIGGLVQEDPLKAADKLLEAFAQKGVIQRESLQRVMAGGQFTDKEANAVRSELSILFQNRRAFTLMSLLTTQRNQVVKESRLAAGAKDIEQLYAQSLDSAQGRILRFEKAMENFRAQVGLPLIEMGTRVAGAMMPLMNIFSQYPELAKWAAYTIIASKGLSGLAQSAFYLRASGLSGFLTETSIGLNGPGGVGPSAVATRQSLSLLGSLKFAGTIAAIGSISLALIDVIERAREINELFEKNKQDAATTYDELMRTGQLYGNQPVPDTQVNALIKRLNEKGELTDALHDKPSLFESPTSYIPFMGRRTVLPDEYFPGMGAYTGGTIEGLFGRKPYQSKLESLLGGFIGQARPDSTFAIEDKVAISRISTLIPEAGDPRVLAGVIRSVKGGALGPEVREKGINEFFRLLNATFGESTFKQAMELAGQGVAEQSKLLTGSMKELFDPVNRLAPAAGRAAIGLDGFADRLGNVTLPTFNGSIVERGGGGTDTTGQPQPIPKTGSSTLDRFFNAVPRKAAGGDVLESGLAIVHKHEKIVPAQVTARWRDNERRPIYLPPIGVEINGPMMAGASGALFPPLKQLSIPSKASGGDVLKDGLAFIHAKEKIVPARVTARWRDEGPRLDATRAIASRAGHVSSKRTVHVTYSPQIAFNGDSASSKSVRDDFKVLLQQHSREVVRIIKHHEFEQDERA